MQIAPEGGVSTQKVNEIKVALRELGLSDRVPTFSPESKAWGADNKSGALRVSSSGQNVWMCPILCPLSIKEHSKR